MPVMLLNYCLFSTLGRFCITRFKCISCPLYSCHCLSIVTLSVENNGVMSCGFLTFKLCHVSSHIYFTILLMSSSWVLLNGSKWDYRTSYSSTMSPSWDWLMSTLVPRLLNVQVHQSPFPYTALFCAAVTSHVLVQWHVWPLSVYLHAWLTWFNFMLLCD